MLVPKPYLILMPQSASCTVFRSGYILHLTPSFRLAAWGGVQSVDEALAIINAAHGKKKKDKHKKDKEKKHKKEKKKGKKEKKHK